MRRWIEFYYAPDQPVLGTDGLVSVDGRFSDQRVMALAQSQALRLRKVKPSISAYKVIAGNSLACTHAITSLIKLEF